MTKDQEERNKKYIFVFSSEIHQREYRHCTGCEEGYPRTCICYGLRHGEFTVGADGYAWIMTKCDSCGHIDRG